MVLVTSFSQVTKNWRLCSASQKQRGHEGPGRVAKYAILCNEGIRTRKKTGRNEDRIKLEYILYIYTYNDNYSCICLFVNFIYLLMLDYASTSDEHYEHGLSTLAQ